MDDWILYREFYDTIFCSRVYGFAIFAVRSFYMIATLWANDESLSSFILFCFYSRSLYIGSSLVAVQNFFELFDRTPMIDNMSNEGQQLVCKYTRNSIYSFIFFMLYLYRLIFVVIYNLIMFILFILLVQHLLFSINFI